MGRSGEWDRARGSGWLTGLWRAAQPGWADPFERLSPAGPLGPAGGSCFLFFLFVFVLSSVFILLFIFLLPLVSLLS